MYRLTMELALLSIVLGVIPSGTGRGAAPPEEDVQGLYVGVAGIGMAQQKLEARVAATGHGTYKVYLRRYVATGSIAKSELDGRTDGDHVLFFGKVEGTPWILSWTSGEMDKRMIRGTYGSYGIVDMHYTTSPAPSQPAPFGAIILLDHVPLDELTKPPLPNGAEQPWKPIKVPAPSAGYPAVPSSNEGPIKYDGIEIPRGGMSSKRSFAGSFRLHVEFLLPLMPEARGQKRSRSGVQLPNGNVIQVLDSFGMIADKGCGCGALYAYKDPDSYFDQFSLASAPPLEWQSFDVDYLVPTKGGGSAGRPRVTVWHNGCKIHDNLELPAQARAGVLRFQDHGDAVVYRNIWVQPQEDK